MTQPRKRPAYEQAARLLKPTGYHPDMPRPATTVAGATLVLLRVLAGVVELVALAYGWDALTASAEVAISGLDATAEAEQAALWVVLGAGAIVLVVETLLAILILRGHNWPRVIVMLIAVISISSAFSAWWVLGEEITIRQGAFLSLSLDILILLALSSRSAAAYARRNERR